MLVGSTSAQSIRLSEANLKQGEVLVVRVESASELEGWIGGRRLDFLPSGRKQERWALWGVDVDEPPGIKRVEVRIAESRTKLVSPFRVHSELFPSEELTVALQFTELSPLLLQRIEVEKREMERIFSERSPTPLWEGKFEMPRLARVTSPFGVRRLFNGNLKSRHFGVDFKAEEGAEIYAPNGGRVVLMKEHFLAGKTLVLDHGVGPHSIFLHLSRFETEEGAWVDKGHLIARVGSTGRTTGPHLHWSVRLAGARVDPVALTKLDFTP
jgi:murein DD-endopeptidase MepM/ murein hydrolase activator NlpD